MNDLPFVGVVFLNENLAQSISFTDGSGKNGKPQVNTDFIRYSQGMWRDSTPLTYGKSGTETGDKTPYIFAQSSLNNDKIWTETSEMNNLGARTILGITDEPILSPRGYIKRNFAIISGTTSSTESFKAEIKQKASSASQFWKATNNTRLVYQPEVHNIYPNPSNGSFTITNLTKNSEIFIIDSQGVTVFSKSYFESSNYTCNVSIAIGVYQISIRTNNRISHQPLLIAN
jgi:hypothetical protein